MYGLSHFYVGGMIGRSWKGQNCQMGTLTSVSSQIKYIGHYSYTDLSQVQLQKKGFYAKAGCNLNIWTFLHRVCFFFPF